MLISKNRDNLLTIYNSVCVVRCLRFKTFSQHLIYSTVITSGIFQSQYAFIFNDLIVIFCCCTSNTWKMSIHRHAIFVPFNFSMMRCRPQDQIISWDSGQPSTPAGDQINTFWKVNVLKLEIIVWYSIV